MGKNKRFSSFFSILSLLIFLNPSSILLGVEILETTPKTYFGPGNGSITFQIPNSWEEKSEIPGPILPFTYGFSDKNDDSWIFAISIIFGPNKEPFTLKKIKKMVEKNLEFLKKVEKDTLVNVPLGEIKGKLTEGYYFSVTDNKPNLSPEEFKFWTNGLVQIESLPFTFSLFTKKKDPGLLQKVLKIVENPTFEADQNTNNEKIDENDQNIQIKSTDQVFEISVPVSEIFLSFPKQGFFPKKVDIGGATQSPRYFIFENEDNRSHLSGWFEPSSRYSGVQNIWKSDVAGWEKTGVPDPEEVQFAKFEDWEIVTYMMNFQELYSYNIKAHLIKSGTWVDLHFSTTGKDKDLLKKDQLDNFFKTMKISEKK